MLTEALSALAAAGGTAVISAMATDTWDAVRTRTARLFGRGDKKREVAAEERLDRTRDELATLSGAELEQAVVVGVARDAPAGPLPQVAFQIRMQVRDRRRDLGQVIADAVMGWMGNRSWVAVISAGSPMAAGAGHQSGRSPHTVTRSWGSATQPSRNTGANSGP